MGQPVFHSLVARANAGQERQCFGWLSSRQSPMGPRRHAACRWPGRDCAFADIERCEGQSDHVEGRGTHSPPQYRRVRRQYRRHSGRQRTLARFGARRLHRDLSARPVKAIATLSCGFDGRSDQATQVGATVATILRGSQTTADRNRSRGRTAIGLKRDAPLRGRFLLVNRSSRIMSAILVRRLRRTHYWITSSAVANRVSRKLANVSTCRM
jgi:hypothetical protein